MNEYSKRVRMMCMAHPEITAIGETIQATLLWDPFLPMEVRLDVGAEEQWLLGRDLLLAGLDGPVGVAGVSEVLIYPWGDLEVVLELVGQGLTASFILSRSEVRAFVNRTVERVDPTGEGPLWVDWDVQFVCLLAGSTELRYRE